jgi:C-terminal processing protease CtpA/Prc
VSGNIGNELLNRFDTYFAFPDSCIYIRPRSNISKPFEFHLINIILKEEKTENGNFIIKSIATETAPYDAGLRAGDQIVTINKYHCDVLDLEDAIALLNKRIGKKMKIKYIRDNKTYICTYIIQPII